MTDSQRRAKPRIFMNRATIAAMAVLAIVVFVPRYRLIHAPLHGDVCAYAIIGHEMMRGRLLYSDLWERKPPLLYITYAAAERVTGYGETQIFLLGLLTALGSLVLIYRIGCSGSRGPVAGLMAAAFWALLNSDLQLIASQPDPEVFINFWLLAGFLLLVNWPADSARANLPWGAMLGLFLAAATLYKHNSLLACLALLCGHVVCRRESRRNLSWVGEVVIAGGVIVMAWAGMLLYFAVNHRAGDFIDVLFRQNMSYSGSMVSNFARAFKISHLFPRFMAWMIAPVGLVAVVGLLKCGRRLPRVRSDWLLLIAWAIGTWASIAVIGYPSPIYHQLWLPIGCIAGGWAGGELLRQPTRARVVAGSLAVTIAMVFLGIRQGSEFLLTPDEWIHRQFPIYDLTGQRQLGLELGQLLEPGESFWVLGDDNTLYFFSKHSPPSGLLFIDPFLYGSEIDVYWQRLLRDLNRTQPALVVLSENTMLFPSSAPIFPWLKQNYEPWNTAMGSPHYRMLVRKNSGLEKRLDNRLGRAWIGQFFW